MSGFLFTPLVSKKVVDDKIKSAKGLLQPIDSPQKEYFLLLLTSRISDFESELLSNTLSSCEKEQVLIQYNRFAKALNNCLKHPERASHSIQYYHKLPYYPVGIHDTEKPSPLLLNIAMNTIKIGLTLLVASIPAFILNPVIGIIMISAAITLFFPSCFYLMIPESPDTSKKKEEEKKILQLGAQLIKPDLEFNNELEVNKKEVDTAIYSY